MLERLNLESLAGVHTSSIKRKGLIHIFSCQKNKKTKHCKISDKYV